MTGSRVRRVEFCQMTHMNRVEGFELVRIEEWQHWERKGKKGTESKSCVSCEALSSFTRAEIGNTGTVMIQFLKQGAVDHFLAIRDRTSGLFRCVYRGFTPFRKKVVKPDWIRWFL